MTTTPDHVQIDFQQVLQNAAVGALVVATCTTLWQMPACRAFLTRPDTKKALRELLSKATDLGWDGPALASG